MKPAFPPVLDIALGLIGMAGGLPSLVLLIVAVSMILLGKLDTTALSGFTTTHLVCIACLVAFVIRQRRYFSKLFRGKT